jgi:transposase-like protein
MQGAADIHENFQFDIMNYIQFPENHWEKIRTIKMMERTNKELRRSKVIGAFPNKE